MQSQVVLGLKQACDEADFNIPFPIRTLYFANQQRKDGKQAVSID